MLSRDAEGAALIAGQPVLDIMRTAKVRTPAYLYDTPSIGAEARALAAGLGDRNFLIAYAAKANTAGPVVRELVEASCGALVSSAAELAACMQCGVPPGRILLGGVVKTEADIDFAIACGDRGTDAIQLEHIEEIGRVRARASALGRPARVALRIRPDIVAETGGQWATGHDACRFGVGLSDLADALDALAQSPGLQLVGLGVHVGSQLTRTKEYLAAAKVLCDAAKDVEDQGNRLEFLDFGGGFGIDYGDGCEATPLDFVQGVARVADRSGMTKHRLVVEPGRCLVGPHGLLATSVVATKVAAGRHWLFVDAGLHSLLRPSLYGVTHRVEPMETLPAEAGPESRAIRWTVVGPGCENTDSFGTWAFGRPPPGQLLIRDVGAYGYTMASHYQGRGLPPEVFIQADGGIEASTHSDAPSWAEQRAAIGERWYLECGLKGMKPTPRRPKAGQD